MKNLIKLSVIPAMLLMFLASCTKEGPAGQDGTNGTDGKDGIAGESGTAGCVQCHTSNENMMLKAAQWENSGHATGTSWARGTSASCAECHSSQGFQEKVATGSVTNAPVMPLAANCYTCHNIHETYTTADWTNKKTTGVEFNQNGVVYESANPNANTCVQCHQTRAITAIDLTSTADYQITSYRFGPHHGPQGNMLAGAGKSGAVELGTDTYTNSTHASLDCISCHMAEGDLTIGGHTNHISTGTWGTDKKINPAGCVTCHSGYTTAADLTAWVEGKRSDNEVLFNQLHDKLFALKLIDASGYVLGDDQTNRAGTSNPLNVSPQIAGAIYNYKFIEEDLSMMIHNPKYAKKLLEQSLAVLP